MKKIIFYGGTGQCKVMRPIADKIGSLVAILDDTPGLTNPFSDVELYSGANCFDEWKNSHHGDDYYFAVTIGNPHAAIRRKKSAFLIEQGLKPISLIHESAIIDESVCIGVGVQIHAGVIISPYAKIGDYCILNTRASVDHDCFLHPGVEIAPGAVLCGEIIIKENTWVGANAVIKQRMSVGRDVIIGAGASVVKNVQDGKVMVGVPAMPIGSR